MKNYKWPKKIYFTWINDSSDCESCGYYDSLELIVSDEFGNQLLSEYSDNHLSPNPIMYEEVRIPFLLGKAGYGDNWEIEENDEGEKIITREGVIYKLTSEEPDILTAIFNELGHEVIHNMVTLYDSETV